MSSPPRISESEWEVMRLLWDRSPQSSQELVEKIQTRRDWNSRTIKTLVSRLVRKGALLHESQGNRYLYRPSVSREECVRAESASFLERVFDGSASPLLAHLLREGKLEQPDLERLRGLLGEREDER